MCPKWIPCDDGKSDDYDSKQTSMCRSCGSLKKLYLVHEDGADYSCYECKEDVEPKFVCILCHNNKIKLYASKF